MLSEMMKRPSRIFILALTLMNFGHSVAEARLAKYQAKDIWLRYAMTRPLNAKNKILPVWIYQQGDGDIHSTYMPLLASGAAQLISETYGVIFVWPEIRREYYAHNLKKYCALDFLHRVDDLASLINDVKAIDGVDKNRIFLIGHSAGAEVVTLTASHRTDIRAVVTLGGGVIQFADYLERIGDLNEVKLAAANTCTEGHLKERGGLFWRQFFYSHLFETILQLPIPYLALMGGRDQVSRIDVQQREFNLLKEKKPNFDYALIEGSTHSFANLKSWAVIAHWTQTLAAGVDVHH